MKKRNNKVNIATRVSSWTKKVSLTCNNCGAYTRDRFEIKDFDSGNFDNRCPICGATNCIEKKNF